ncbi:MAG: hypothetical protein AAF125_18170 [Chloroflexota bacterium]
MIGFLRGAGALILLWTVGVAFSAGVGTFASGNVLAFDSNRTGNYEIFLLDLDTGVLLNVTNDSAQDRNPAWSADGRFLAFESVQRGVGNGIYLIDMHNRNREPVRVTPEFVRAVQPTFSPVGNYIAFSGAMDNMFNNDIFTVNLFDKQVVQVTNTPNVYDYGPDWSPDGKFLTYGSYAQTINAPADIFVQPFNEAALQLATTRAQTTTGPLKVSEDDQAADPAWTPDGRILFRYDLAPFSLYVTAPTLDAPDEPLLTHREVVDKPAMSPDGQWVAYSSANGRVDPWRALKVARTNGESPAFWVTYGAQAGPYTDGAPAWMPPRR